MPAESTDVSKATPLRVVVLSPAWRAILGLLAITTWAGLAYLLFQLWTVDELRNKPLAIFRLFAAVYAAPAAAAWCIRQAFAARLWLESGHLVIEASGGRREIAVASLEAVTAWKWPIPGLGFDLETNDGTIAPSLLPRNGESLRRADLSAAGASLRAEEPESNVHRAMRARLAAQRTWLDHPFVKFVVFPLLPALPAFRLHQIIAYGGTFGEYLTYGLRAYLLALAIWWGSWAIGMGLYAACLRTIATIAAIAAAAAAPRIVRPFVGFNEWLMRLAYYGGVPGVLAWQLWPW